MNDCHPHTHSHTASHLYAIKYSFYSRPIPLNLLYNANTNVDDEQMAMITNTIFHT